MVLLNEYSCWLEHDEEEGDEVAFLIIITLSW